MTMEYKQSLTELNIILNYMDTELTKKIPIKLLSFIKQNMDISYTPNISPNIPIYEQNLKHDTKVLLSLIYRDYLVESEKKKELIEKDLLDKQKYEEELRKKYNPDNIFNNKTQNKEEIIYEPYNQENTALIEYKEQKWYQKIFVKILSIFRK